MMHPIIRIASFVVFTLMLVTGGKGSLLMGAGLLAVSFARAGMGAWRPSWRLVWRMRWLFLSLAVVYFWFTPGTTILPSSAAVAAWLPTVEGLMQGGLRITALVLMVMAASLLLQVTPRDELLAAVYWLAAPLRMAGVARERLAVRIALSLAAVGEVQTQLREVLAERRTKDSPWVRIGGVAAAVFGRVMARAEAAPCVTLSLPMHSAPPAAQWGWPALVAASMWAAGRLAG